MRWVPRKSFHTGVVGESHANEDGTSRQEIIGRCRVGEVMRLVREPNNPFDPNAVRVCRETGETIGYLNRACARPTADDLDAGEPVGSVIGSVGQGESGLAGVVLYLTKFVLEYDAHEVQRVTRAATRVGSEVCRIVRLGSGEEVTELWGDGAWWRPGPSREAFTWQRHLKPAELLKLGIPANEAVTAGPPEIPTGPPASDPR